MKINLYAKPKMLKTDFVGSYLIPNFLEPPKVILWGTRVFQYDQYHSTPDECNYYEVFFYTIIETEGLK